MGFLGLFKHDKTAEELTANLPVGEPDFLKEAENTVIPKGEVRQEVEPELALWLSNGTTIRNMKELAAALKKITAKAYKEHVTEERNEIAEWVQEILNDEELARQLRKAGTKLKSAKCVEKRIKQLKVTRRKGASAKLPKASAAKKGPDEFPELLDIPPITELPLDVEPKKSRASLWPFKQKKGSTAEETVSPLPEIPLLPEEAKTEGLKGLPDLPIAEVDEQQAALPQLPELQISAEAEETAQTFWPFKRKKREHVPEEAPQQQEWDTSPALPKENEILPMPEMPAEEKKPKEHRGFFHFMKKTKQEQPVRPIMAEPMQEIETANAEPALFEAEPHHLSWEEQSVKEEVAINPSPEQAAEKAETPAKKLKPELKSYEEAALDKKESELEQLEKGLNLEEDALNKKRLEVTRKRYDLIKQKGEIESQKFELFMKRQKLSKQKEESLMDGNDLGISHQRETKGMPDFRLSGAYGKERLEALLEEAKQHIRQNNVEEARNSLQEVQSVFHTTYMNSSDKKHMEYEILEVEADIKLASLN